jgi:3-deoxy-D-manno-octulosonic-acid transferase
VAAGALALSPHWRDGWRERIGAGAAVAPGALWIHGASVGEIQAAFRLVDALRDKGHRVVASTSTTTGRDVLRRARPDVPSRLAPLDHPWCVQAALDRVRPRALVLIETELWPSWIAAAERGGIPVVLVSGRISDRSLPRYRKIAPFLARTLRRMSAIGARTELDRERFVALGAPPERVTVSGDLKLEPGAPPPPLASDLADALGAAPLLVAASTHPGEEAAVLDAFAAVRSAQREALLVLAPRRPDRADDVVALVRGRGLPLQRRSALPARPLASGEVLVLDSLGELAALLPRAAGAFVGGTLAPIGGHNVLEPLMAQRPVCFGPHTTNVTHAVRILEDCGAGVEVADGAALGRVFQEWIADPERATECGRAGWRALQGHRGSAARAAELVVRTLGAG